MKKKILFLIIFFIVLFSCEKKTPVEEESSFELHKDNEFKAEELKKGNAYGVVNTNRLRFRLDPDLNSKTLRFLDKGIIVEIIKKDTKRVKISEMEDYWYQAEYSGITGWVFGHFIDVYDTYDNARDQARQYTQNDSELAKNDGPVIYDDAINKNLFFLKNGKIIRVIDGKAGIAEKLKIPSDLYVTYYFFADSPSLIYYIARQQNASGENGNLYVYDLEKGKSLLLLNDIYFASYNEDEKKSMLFLKLKEREGKKHWIILRAKINNITDVREVASIRQKRGNEKAENDIFLKTLDREMGSLINLTIEPRGRFIYFKPPEENLTYLISTINGNFIQIENSEGSMFEIDSYRYITVNSQESSDGQALYNIVLKDKYSGMEKEIVTSRLYPVDFVVSPKKNLIAMSMIDIDKKSQDYYPSSIYVLSLTSYSLIAISTEGNSYQPRWINNFLK